MEFYENGGLARANVSWAPLPPDPPSNLVASAASTSQINLSWADNSSFELGFKIERWSGSGYSQINVVGANVTTYTDSGLAHSTTYTYRVRAFNNGGDSGYSNESSATTLTPPPPPPSNLVASAASSSQINLSWTDNSSLENGFKIERWNGSSYSQINTVGANATTYTDSGLVPSTTYYYRVRAYNSVGDSGYSNESSATTLSCNYSLNPTSKLVVLDGASFNVSVTTSPGCSWTAHSNNSWISVSSGGGVGSGVVNVYVDSNYPNPARQGSLTIAGINFHVQQAGCLGGRPEKCYPN